MPRRTARLALVLLGIASLALAFFALGPFASDAMAQATGGSFGGGSWGGGGGGGGRSDYGGGGYSGGGYSGGGDGSGLIALVFLAFRINPIFGLLVLGVIVVAAHDENNQAKTGDTVEIAEGRPISKTKAWTVTRVVQTAQIV